MPRTARSTAPPPVLRLPPGTPSDELVLEVLGEVAPDMGVDRIVMWAWHPDLRVAHCFARRLPALMGEPLCAATARLLLYARANADAGPRATNWTPLHDMLDALAAWPDPEDVPRVTHWLAAWPVTTDLLPRRIRPLESHLYALRRWARRAPTARVVVDLLTSIDSPRARAVLAQHAPLSDALLDVVADMPSLAAALQRNREWTARHAGRFAARLTDRLAGASADIAVAEASEALRALARQHGGVSSAVRHRLLTLGVAETAPQPPRAARAAAGLLLDPGLGARGTELGALYAALANTPGHAMAWRQTTLHLLHHPALSRELCRRILRDFPDDPAVAQAVLAAPVAQRDAVVLDVLAGSQATETLSALLLVVRGRRFRRVLQRLARLDPAAVASLLEAPPGALRERLRRQDLLRLLLVDDERVRRAAAVFPRPPAFIALGVSPT